MAGKTALNYVQQYGRQLLGGGARPAQPALGGMIDEGGAIGVQPAGQQASGALTFPMDSAPAGQPLQQSAPAFATPAAPAEAAPAQGKSDFHTLAAQTSDEDKEKIADAMDAEAKKRGTTLKAVFNERLADGTIKVPSVGKKFDRKQMGLFLFEAGLRTMQRASKGEDAFGAVSGGVLDTIEAGQRKQAGIQERDDKLGEAQKDRDLRTGEGKAERDARREDSEADRALRKGESEADRKARREEADADRVLRRNLAAAENISRERQTKMSRGKDADTLIGEDGMVYWKPDAPGSAGEPVMVMKGGKPTQLKAAVKPDGGAVTEELVLKEANNIRAGLDKDITAKVNIGGKSVQWRSLDEKAKAAYMETVKASMRQTDSTDAESAVPDWAR
jgi:hypothetical protein